MASLGAFGEKAYAIFDERVEGFAFACPGVLISSTSVRSEWETYPALPGGQWKLSYEDVGRTFVGRGEDTVSAYLDLIRARLDIEA